MSKGIEGLTIDWEIADRITLLTLVDAYKGNEESIEELKAKKKKKGLEPFQEEDLAYNKNLRNNLKGVIRYYTTVDQYEELIGESK